MQSKIIPKPPQGRADQVAQIIIARICNGNYKPGMKIGERKLARELHMSQIPVREAFEKLIQRGWIEKILKKGAFIRKFNEDEIIKLFEVRQIIEAGAIYLLASRITDKHLKKLEIIVQQLKAASHTGNVMFYEDADLEFHKSIIMFVDNPRMLDIYDNILRQSHGFFLSTAVKAAFSWGRQLENNVSGHHKILNALKERNAQKAQREIISHIKLGCNFAVMIAQAQSIIEPNSNVITSR